MRQAIDFKTVIFDLDGTLIDTEPAAAQAIRASFKDWGIQIDETDARFVTGRTWASAFNYLFSRYSIPVSAEEASSLMMAKYRETLENDLTIVPGSVAAVKSLAERFPLALVSGSGRKEILWALNKLGIRDHFQLILGAEDYPRSKPAPDGYLSALSQIGHTADRALIFEDSTAGIASGRAAGAWVVAITSTNHFDQDTSAAHHHIEDLQPVTADWVMQLGNKLKV